MRLVAGLGCTSRAEASEILAVIDHALGLAGVGREALAEFVTTERRRGHGGIEQAAAVLGVPVRYLDDAVLAEQQDRLLRPSARVAAHTGLSGIAEAAALTAGELVVPKQVGRGATCALARISEA